MTSKELNQRLKNGILDNLYLFYGCEDYIKDTYINKIKEKVLKNDLMGINFTQFDEIPTKDELIEVIESAPILSEKKVVLLNSLNIITSSLKKDLKNVICDILSDIPEYTIVIIKEKEGDLKKISKPVFNIIKKSGVEVLCNYLEYHDLLSFVNRQFLNYDKKIRKDDLEYFLSICDSSIHSILGEVEKISAYLGNEDTVDKKIIDLMVKRSIEDRVFGLSDAIISQDTKLAYHILQDLMLLKNQHPSGKIFSIICDHFMNLYVIANNQKERIPNDVTINILELQGRNFLIKKYQNQGSKIDFKKLRKIIDLLNDLDYRIKNGLVEPYYAIEQVITAV